MQRYLGLKMELYLHIGFINMKDFIGKELKIGDKVVATSSRYEELNLAIVEGFTPQKVRIKILASNNYYNRAGKVCLKFNNQVVKVDDE